MADIITLLTTIIGQVTTRDLCYLMRMTDIQVTIINMIDLPADMNPLDTVHISARSRHPVVNRHIEGQPQPFPIL